MGMYSVHYELHGNVRQSGRHVPVGSARNVFITVNHDHSAEVKANGEIKKDCRSVLPQFGKDRDLKLCYVEESQHSTVIKRSMGLYFIERVSYRHINCPHDVKALQAAGGRVDASNLPVRLIDIQGTLDVSAHGGVCFILPTDWSFHVLSHTWSLVCRDMSRSIGEKVDSAADYNKAFEGAKLHQGKAAACYHKLLDLLTLLKEEGVKAIWFDALCINQMDYQEKEREIIRMGAYFGCSLGCYVSAHGIGHSQGFKLWAENGDWPRWFKRVWTLQDFLLPRKVTFIVEGLARRTIQYVNHFIGKGGVPGLCECALPPRNIFFRASLKEIQFDACEKDEILCSSQGRLQIPCDTCRCAEFIRKSHQQPGVYFVDREAYYFLCELDRRDPVSWFEIPYYWNLFALAHEPCTAAIGRVVEMLRLRECTNEEDRVLGVLGLLQTAGDQVGQLQLRSGKRLFEQLLNLHHYCGVDVFFKLCLIGPKGFQRKGMSWAPCLESSNLEMYQPVPFGEWETSTCFHGLATMVNVSSRGLKLHAQVACGNLTPRGQSMRCMKPGKHSFLDLDFSASSKSKYEKLAQPLWTQIMATDGEDVCYSCYYHDTNCTHWIRECDLEVGESHTFPLKAHSLQGCTLHDGHMVIQDSWIGTCSMRNVTGRCTRSTQFVMSFSGFSIHALKGFPVWLVLFGMTHKTDQMTHKTDQCMVGMVCIANDDEGSELHKIGIFSCHMAHPYDSLFFRDVPRQICLIGGFDANSVATYVSQ